MKPAVEVCDLFELVLEDHYKTSKKKQTTIKKSQVLETKKSKLLDKLLDQVISDEDYKTHNKGILNDYQKDLSEYIKF